MAASENLSIFFKERAAASERYQSTLLLKENVQLIFFLCVAPSRNILMFFNERAAASEKILTTGFSENCPEENCPQP